MLYIVLLGLYLRIGIGGVAMCSCRFYDIVCNEGFCIFGAKIGIFYGSHVLCKVEFEDLCYLDVCGICGFPIVV